MTRRAPFVYGLLMLIFAAILGWQAVEHTRVRKAARSALIYRARDITGTLGLVIRSQRRFGVVVSQSRLEPALNELINSEELISVALLNAAGEVVASAGDPIHFESKGMPPSGERWDKETVTFVNLVDLGSAVAPEGATNPPPTIILPSGQSGGPSREDRPRFPGFGPRSRDGTNSTTDRRSASESQARDHEENDRENRTRDERRGARDSRARFGRPPWMNEEEFKSLIEKQGLHGLAIVISTDAVRTAVAHDLWMRGLVGFFGFISVLGIGFAWRSLAKSSEFEMRLLRASEMNSHLREMNVAAAGLAHETRNPLNIIRGLAQMISKNNAAPLEIKENASRITNEVDLVTSQLNEFINYSKPRELRRTAVDLHQVMAEVVRALQTDLEDKEIKLALSHEQLFADADERLLRQVLFNLLINAIQAVEPGGEIALAIKRTNGHAAIEVRDNGPGVAPEHREEIFRPYFTTHQKGTGLGLAVVRQIVLAHGWDIEYESNDPKGALFRVSRLQILSKA